MALMKNISYTIYLNDNDLKEIDSALPQLAKRKLILKNTLMMEWNNMPTQNFFELLENFNLSFVKEIDDECGSDDGTLSDSGFSKVIQTIDDKVTSYIENNEIEIKVTDFSSDSELYDWLDNYTIRGIISGLSDVLWDNRNNSLADKIIQEIATKD